MSGKSGAPSSGAPPSSAVDGPGGPIQGIKQAHADLVAWCYKPHGAATDEQLRTVDAAGVKREHIAYGLIGLTSLYLMTGEEAMFVSNLITFLYPAAVSVDIIRHKVRTALLVFLFLPQTQGAQLIFTKVIEPIAKAVEGFAKKA